MLEINLSNLKPKYTYDGINKATSSTCADMNGFAGFYKVSTLF